MSMIEVKVPDIGDYKEVEVIEVLVSVGDEIAIDDTIISLESDKATLEVPSTHSGVIKELKISVGDKVSEGSLVLLLEANLETGGEKVGQKAQEVTPTQKTSAEKNFNTLPPQHHRHHQIKVESVADDDTDLSCDVMVLGSGPGGYTAAFRAADLGLSVILVEKHDKIGGVCLNVGCIPSKALLHTAKVIDEADEMKAHGISFGKPKIDIEKLRDWKDSIINRLTGGLKDMAKKRKVKIVQGFGKFIDDHHLEVTADDQSQKIYFKNAIIAAGSTPVKLPFLPDDSRIINSTGALSLKDIPKHLLVLGGGIIGLEMATVYRALGSKITVVEAFDTLMAGADKDVVRPYQKRVANQYENIWLETKVTGVEATKAGLKTTFEGKHAPDKPDLIRCHFECCWEGTQW